MSKSRLRLGGRLACGAGGNGFLGTAFEGWADRALDGAIADTDKFEDGAGSGIAKAGLCEAEDAGVTARPIDEARRNFAEQNADGVLIAEELKTAATSGDGRGDGLVPRGPAFTLSPRFPGIGTAFGGRAELGGGLFSSQALAGDGDALLDERSNFLGLRNGGDDTALYGRLVGVEFGIAFGKEERAGEAPQQGALMFRASAEFSAAFSMSHDGTVGSIGR